MKKGKTSWKTYDKINTYLAFKYGTTHQTIMRIRSFWGDKRTKEWLLLWTRKRIEGAKSIEKKKEFETFYAFLSNLTDDQLIDINKYWARFNPRLLL